MYSVGPCDIYDTFARERYCSECLPVRSNTTESGYSWSSETPILNDQFTCQAIYYGLSTNTITATETPNGRLFRSPAARLVCPRHSQSGRVRIRRRFRSNLLAGI